MNAIAISLVVSLSVPAFLVRAEVQLPSPAPDGVAWAAGEIREALIAAGVPARQANIAVQVDAEAKLPPESFELAVQGEGVRVRGGDAPGAMYGLLEVAEQIRNSGARDNWQKVLEALSPTRQKPFLEFRASNPFIHTVPSLLLDDVEMWKRYIDLLARCRFNVLDVHGGYDLQSTLFPNLYPLLVRVKDFPAVGNPEEQRKNLKNFREIAAYAHRRCLKVAFMNYEAGSSGAPKEHLADYTAKAVATLLREMPELDMLGFRVGESGQPAEFFRKAYLKGVADSGRKDIRLYTRSWLTTQAALEKIAHSSDGRLDIEVKYNGEQLGLPYQAIHGGLESYSYEGYLRGDALFRVIWQVRANGTHRYWAWAETEFIRRCVGTLTLGQARGFSLEPPICYFPVRAATYYARREDQEVHKYIWEKHWMSFLAWGRLAYNPQLPERTLVAAFEQRFGPPGREIYQAMQAAGRIVPLALAYRYLGPDHRDFSPETEAADSEEAWNPMLKRTAFADLSPMDDRNFLSIQDFVANKIARQADGRIGPEQVASLFSAAAAETRTFSERVRLPASQAAAEWRLLKTDLLASAALGEYYAARIRGTTHLAYARQAGCEADYQKALTLLAESRAAWHTLAQTADAVYAPLHDALREQDNFRWSQELRTLETRDAQLAADFPLKADASPLEFTSAERGQETGIAVKEVQHAPDAAGIARITCKVTTAAPVKAVLLWHKRLPSTEKWQSEEMGGQEDFSVTIPLTAEGLMYQIEVRDSSGTAAIFPPALKRTPYWVIAPQDLHGLNLPDPSPKLASPKIQDK